MRLLAFATLIVSATTWSGCASAPYPSTSPDRSFKIRYRTNVADLPAGNALDLWIPIPSDDPYQHITDLEVKVPSSLKWEKTTEAVYGNRMVHISGETADPALTVDIAYHVDRWTNERDIAATMPNPRATPMRERELFLKPSTLCTVTPEIQQIRASLVKDGQSTIEKARAFYDHVLDKMTYDKSGTGWGRGSTEHACSVGKGNCTDFHSYFISLCLAEGIPARFQIGLFGSYDRKDGEYKTGGYHCWAEFYADGVGWVPVDISEADKDPSKTDAFFGLHTPNRVTLSTGRDIDLAPKQHGDPLNYLLYPYAEVDGAVHEVQKVSYWTDL